ncbi:MAG: class I SAM-dependent methyltransferase [Candidatus Thorarchaeota archaeon]
MSRTHGSKWAFKMMSLIHDNPFRRKFSNPQKTLENARLKPGLNVLEVGCGPGFFTIPAAKIVTASGTLYALDIHPLAKKRIEEKIKAEDLTNIKTILASATDTGLPDQSIDLAFFFGVPRILRNESLFRDILDEMYRVLRDDGIISIKTSKNVSEIVENKQFIHIETQNGIQIFKRN